VLRASTDVYTAGYVYDVTEFLDGEYRLFLCTHRDNYNG
jgi:hypothetical protein